MPENGSSALFPRSTSAQSSTPAASLQIDIEKLTEKVYQLMRADLRLARARSTTHSTRK